MKTRVATPLAGIYQDFRAVSSDAAGPNEVMTRDARQASAQIVFLKPGAASAFRDGVLFLGSTGVPTPDTAALQIAPEPKRVRAAFKQFPDEVFALARGPNREDLAFRTSSTHILARELTPQAIESAIAAQRYYSAEDWVCDPAGFFFIAENTLGAFDIGDTVPILPGTRLRVNLPISAHIRIEHAGAVVAEGTDRQFTYSVKAQGDYTAVVNVALDGEETNWIISEPIHIGKAPPLDLPIGSISDSVEVRRAIPYIDDGLDKHKLDLYLPKGKKNFPVMVFFHGGSWREGDRSMYALFGNRFAKAGIGVAIPSYRLMPKNPHPAQIDDAAAAFGWVYRNIAQFDGDASRLYLVGHSAGGHLAALLALDDDYLKRSGVPPTSIRGVASMSGVYDVGSLTAFQNADDDPSPIHHVHTNAPRFLITYCQWDYFGLPKQARDFEQALEKQFVPARLIFIPGQSHISEIVRTLKDDDATARALIDFIR